jgi:hypothetical protein
MGHFCDNASEAVKKMMKAVAFKRDILFNNEEESDEEESNADESDKQESDEDIEASKRDVAPRALKDDLTR